TGTHDLPDLETASAPETGDALGRLAPVELHDVEPEPLRGRGELVRRRLDEHADPAGSATPLEDPRGFLHGAAPPTAGRQDHPNVTGAGRPGDGGVLRTTDTADLDPDAHAVFASRGRPASAAAAAPTSGARMSDSPTRIAWTPAAPSRSTSEGVRIPLSATSVRSAGTLSARPSTTDRSVRNVARSRLLTPMISAPAASAR